MLELSRDERTVISIMLPNMVALPHVTVELPPSGLDNVQFSLTGPARAAPGSVFHLQFWAHFREQIDEIVRMARSVLQLTEDDPLNVASEGPFQVPRNSRLSVGLRIEELEVLSPHKRVLWVGEIGSTSFVVRIPGSAREGTRVGVATIRVNGSRIARMEFLVSVSSANTTETGGPIEAKVVAHKTAFASYASEDRDAVVARVHGMQKAVPSLHIFMDVINLRSGQHWERELWDAIAKSDVMYLFWCRHASASPWVSKEWRYALEKKGLDFIDPVPLEGPELAPPPVELVEKHFNDPLLAYFSAESGRLHGARNAAGA